MLKNIFVKTLHNYASKWLVLSIDLFLVCIAFILTYLIRFDIRFDFEASVLVPQLVLVILAAVFSFLLIGSYKGVVRHTGTRDVFNVFIAVTIFSILIVFVTIGNHWLGVYEDFTIPQSIIVIHYLVSIFVLIVSRYIFKAFYEIISTELKTITNALIYGAGDSGTLAYNALNKERDINYQISGFIDDDKTKVNKKIDGIKIYKLSSINKEFVEKKNITEVIISMQTIKPTRLLEITDSYVLKKSGISKINLSFSTEIKSFIPVVSGFFSYITGNEVTLLIDGTLKVKALGVSKKIKINESLSVKY